MGVPYSFLGNGAPDLVDVLGLDALVLNMDGLLGHTSFVVTRPGGGVRVYHYYAEGHYLNPGSSATCQALFCDRVRVWFDDYPSVEDYISTGIGLGGSFSVWAYALGTPADDQRIMDQLDPLAKDASECCYSVVGGNQCHSNSYGWFWDYLDGSTRTVPHTPGTPPAPPFLGVDVPPYFYATDDWGIPVLPW